MPSVRTHLLFACLIAGLAILGITGIAPAPQAHSPISADEFARAIVEHRQPLIDLYFNQHLDPNARGTDDRPLILTATLEKDWTTVQRLLKAGASVDLGDGEGLKPIMAAATSGDINIVNQFISLATNVAATDRSGRTALHYAVTAGKEEAVKALLPLTPDLEKPCGDGCDLLGMAQESGNWKIFDILLRQMPLQQEWSSSTLRALEAALANGNQDQTRLLLSKHAAPPTPEGRTVPLLAYAIASNDLPLFKTLLDCGADPDTVLPDKCDKEFLASLPKKSLQNFIPYDKGVTVLMLAAGLGQTDCVEALLAAGADKNRSTKRYKMMALYLAAQNDQWRVTQILLGSGPPPEQLRIEITLASQNAAIIKDGVPVFTTNCSTGRSGFATRTGDYVITDKGSQPSFHNL